MRKYFNSNSTELQGTCIPFAIRIIPCTVTYITYILVALHAVHMYLHVFTRSMA